MGKPKAKELLQAEHDMFSSSLLTPVKVALHIHFKSPASAYYQLLSQQHQSLTAKYVTCFNLVNYNNSLLTGFQPPLE